MITLIPWGFKFGTPPANFFFDVSYFKNPWREERLRNGSKEDILKFMREQKSFNDITGAIARVIAGYAIAFPNENMVFALCCSAGEYRSPVAVIEVSIKLAMLKVAHEIIKSPNSKI